MSRLLFALAIVISLCAEFTYSSMSEHYYITSSLTAPCPQEPCLTLSQFVEDYSSYHRSDSEMSLLFLPGNHTLDYELSMAHIKSFTMTSTVSDNKTVLVECACLSGRFNISNTMFISIKGLHFIGCGGNTVGQVDQLIVEDTIFQGVEDRGTALILVEVSFVSITKSLFLFNSHWNNSEHPIQTMIKSDLNISDHYDLELNVTESFSTGGALFAAISNITIESSKFLKNTAELGGVLFAHNSSIRLVRSTFSSNEADYGAVMGTSQSFLYISNCSFSTNVAEYHGGVVISYKDVYTISSTNFTSNSAGLTGGVVDTNHSFFNITDSTFSDNLAEGGGGVIYAQNSFFSASHVTCTNNSVYSYGGVIYSKESSYNITTSTFSNNSASFGGVLEMYMSSADLANCTFIYNNADHDSGAIWCVDGLVSTTNSKFSNNRAGEFGGVMVTSNCSIHSTNDTFDNNLGSLYTFNSRLTFSGNTSFTNCAESPSKIISKDIVTFQEGGAITSFKSTIIFTGVSSLTTNQARDGGAILATDSIITMYGNIEIAHNVAISRNGGGVSLYRSMLEIKGNCYISDNSATRGGGVHAHSSYVTVYQPAVLWLINNNAWHGGAMYLEVNPKLYLLKNFQYTSDDELLSFVSNNASYGGAVYVADDTNSVACSSNTDCFIQVLTDAPDFDLQSHVNIIFNGNTATEEGSNLFGGLLDRCIPSAFAEISRNSRADYNGITYLGNISNLTLNSIASLPVQVCFCTSDGQPNCSYQPPPMNVKKGKAFKVPLVAIDQVGNPVDATIISSLTFSEGGFGESQHTQKVGWNCTDLTFNVFSPHDSETIVLFADGPCRNSAPSIRHLDIQFLNCTCPIGFENSSNRPTACECICDAKLSPYIASCNSTTKLLLLRENNSAWISYANDTDPPGYIIHPNCPTDYCQPSAKNVSINLNLPNGVDTQCAYNRTGVLCGACQKHLSLSLGSSRCLPCQSYWPVNLIAILLAAAITGILLVTLLLVLNLTVAVGLVNSFIFYANLVSVGSTVFFPSSEPSFPTVFIDWLNLDIGIDVCFIEGLDAYTKVWLQLAFPAYMISLVAMIIVISEFSPKFARLIGKRDPVATLATLILLSYAKLLSITIAVLSFAVLHYLDGAREIVWFLDGNVKYFQGKHIPLVIIALFIILIGLPYTILLFFWQWFVRAPKGKFINWTRNTKLNAFIATYHVPFNSKYRFWTGLLLLLRVFLYITSVTSSADPQTPLLAIIITVGSLLFFKNVSTEQVYKNRTVDVVETCLYFNLLVLTAFSLYHFKYDIKKQTAIGYISTIITLILLIGVVVYHVAQLIKADKTKECTQQPAFDQPNKSEVTHSIIEVPKPLRDSQANELESIQESTGDPVVSLPYE